MVGRPPTTRSQVRIDCNVQALSRRGGREDWSGRVAALVSLATLGSPLTSFADEPAAAVEQIVVTGDASVVERLNGVGSGTEIDADTIRLVGQNHIYETMVRVPGVWVS